jgi:hypothetical protein
MEMQGLPRLNEGCADNVGTCDGSRFRPSRKQNTVPVAVKDWLGCGWKRGIPVAGGFRALARQARSSLSTRCRDLCRIRVIGSWVYVKALPTHAAIIAAVHRRSLSRYFGGWIGAGPLVGEGPHHDGANMYCYPEFQVSMFGLT